MTIAEVMAELTTIFRDVLDNEGICLEATTTADDIEEWDSITHMMLVVDIEKRFGVKFTSAEVRNWAKVGDLAANIIQKVDKQA